MELKREGITFIALNKQETMTDITKMVLIANEPTSNLTENKDSITEMIITLFFETGGEVTNPPKHRYYPIFILKD